MRGWKLRSEILPSCALLVALLLAALPAPAKMPKEAQEALRKKYEGKEAAILVGGIPARLGKRSVTPTDPVGGYGAGGMEARTVVTPAKVDIRGGQMGGKDPKATAEFAKGDVVTIEDLRFKKDHLEVVIQDPGVATEKTRGAVLNLFLDPAMLDRGNVDEISALIDAWLKLQ